MPDEIVPDGTPGETPTVPPATEPAAPKTGETPSEAERQLQHFKNEAEKNDRLLKKAEAENAKLLKAEETRKQSEMTEIERVKAQAEGAAAENARLTRQLHVRDAAAKHGLSPDDYEFLTGSTEEEIHTSAEKFAARLKAAAPATPAPDPKTSTAPRKPLAPASNPGVDDVKVMDKARENQIRGKNLWPGVKPG